MDLSKFNPADFGFDLNNREIAALIWLAAITSGVLLWKQMRPSALGVVRAFFVWPLQRVFLAMTAYTVIMVTGLARLNLWEWTNLKTTLLWWLTVGFASVFESQRIASERGGFRKLLTDAVNWTAAITFIAEFGSFPLPVEIVLPVPLTFVALMLAMAPHQPGASILIKPLTWIMTAAGLTYFAWSAHKIIAAPSEFLDWNTLREFGDPILLSVSFIPFLFGLSIRMTHETIFTSLKVMWTRQDLAAYAQRRALWSFGMDLDGMKRLARDLKMNDIEDRRGVNDAIRQIKRLKRREKNPLPTAPDKGWSPYEAVRFLEKEGVIAGDWHPSFGEWRAEATVVKLAEGSLSDNVSFYLSGSEFAATRLSLFLHADNRNDAAASDARFYTMVRALLCHAATPESAEAIFTRLRDQTDVVIREDGWRFSMKRDDWGTAKFGGYSRRFAVSHKAHVPTEFDEEYYERLVPEAPPS